MAMKIAEAVVGPKYLDAILSNRASLQNLAIITVVIFILLLVVVAATRAASTPQEVIAGGITTTVEHPSVGSQPTASSTQYGIIFQLNDTNFSTTNYGHLDDSWHRVYNTSDVVNLVTGLVLNLMFNDPILLMSMIFMLSVPLMFFTKLRMY